MSAFAKSTYNSASYLAARPTYSAALYNRIKTYFQAQNHTGTQSGTIAVDVGCGPGSATLPLSNHFDKVVGIDNSSNMVETAANQVKGLHSNVSFKQGNDVDFVDHFEPQSVDAVTVAQAIHWFKMPDFFVNCHRILKPNGIVAFWGYADAVVENVPSITDLHLKYMYDKQYMGNYWEPGRFLLRNYLRDIQPPETLFRNIERHENLINTGPSPQPPVFDLTRELTVKQFVDHLRTASCYYAWKKANPDEPDMCDRFMEELKSSTGLTDSSTINLKYPTILVMATKKSP